MNCCESKLVSDIYILLSISFEIKFIFCLVLFIISLFKTWEKIGQILERNTAYITVDHCSRKIPIITCLVYILRANQNMTRQVALLNDHNLKQGIALGMVFYFQNCFDLL